MVVLGYPKLHTKLQGHKSISSREEAFYYVFLYMGMVALLPRDLDDLNIFSFLLIRALYDFYGPVTIVRGH